MKERKQIVRTGLSIDPEIVNPLICLGGFLAIGGIAVGLSRYCCAYAYDDKSKYCFEYDTNKSGEYIAKGTINYEILKNCCFVEIENPSWKSTEFYICKKETTYYSNNTSTSKYINLLNNKQIYKSESENESENDGRKIVNEISLEDYLYAFDELKEVYTPDDVRNILNKMKEATLEEKESVLIVNSNLSKVFTKVKKI